MALQGKSNLLAGLDGVFARRFSRSRMDAGGRGFKIGAIFGRMPEKRLSHRAAAAVSCADKENAFCRMVAHEKGRNLGGFSAKGNGPAALNVGCVALRALAQSGMFGFGVKLS